MKRLDELTEELEKSHQAEVEDIKHSISQQYEGKIIILFTVFILYSFFPLRTPLFFVNCYTIFISEYDFYMCLPGCWRIVAELIISRTDSLFFALVG